jgi:hydroxyethylthiazole kinase
MHHPAAALTDPAAAAATLLERLRTRAPRVHCITNNVAQNFTANILLAAGCVPSMTVSPEEVAAFAAGSQALMINLGTFDAERSAAAEIVVQVAGENKLPWVLDPVFIDRSAQRAAFARHLVALGPAVARLNAAEFAALTGGGASPAALARFAREKKLVLALSGETDIVADGERLASIANGHPLMAKVTAMGCAGSALVAACLAVEGDAFRAAVAALLLLGVAGELAAEHARGPGSFAGAIIDALYAIDGATVKARAKVS